MDQTYYNHYTHVAESWWDRRRFLAYWWRIYANDSYWAPPHFPTLRRVLEPTGCSHIARLSPTLTYIEAMPRRGRSSSSDHLSITTPTLEIPVAASVVLQDPRRRDGTAYLALLHCVNDAGTLEKYLDSLAELLVMKGYNRVIGPIGLSAHLGSGLLQDFWSDLPPLHTPYNPPYLPEIADQILRPLARGQLFHLDVSQEFSLRSFPAELRPFDPARLSTDLLPLCREACLSWPRCDFVPPDAEEADFIVSWLKRWPLYGWLAEVDHQPVGFILVQPDLAPRLRRARGGRNPLWRLWLAWASHRPVRQGRILYGAVLPAWRGQGIGRRLLHQALVLARKQGWQSLSTGPLPSTAQANKFLEHHGAKPRQTYFLYQREL